MAGKAVIAVTLLMMLTGDPPPGWSLVGDGAVYPSQGVTLVTFVLAGLGHRGHLDHHGPHLHGPGLVAERGHRAALQ
jgi:hypothetical protein